MTGMNLKWQILASFDSDIRYIPINGVLSKTLFDTGESEDFVGTHFVTTNRLSTRRYENPLSIQQAVQGSKPKCNATAVIDIKFGERARNRELSRSTGKL